LLLTERPIKATIKLANGKEYLLASSARYILVSSPIFFCSFIVFFNSFIVSILGSSADALIKLLGSSLYKSDLYSLLETVSFVSTL